MLYAVVEEHAEAFFAHLREQGASIRYRIAVGPIAGTKTLRLHTPGAAHESAQQLKSFTAERDGFSLNAAVAAGPTTGESSSACAATWRARPLRVSVVAATVTGWWSTS